MSDARRKDEIRRLRTQVMALEARLVLLSYLKGVEKPSASSQSFGFGCPNGKRVSAAVVWKDLARRHRRLQLSAEEENARLRKMVERQRRTLAGVRRLVERAGDVDAKRQETQRRLRQEQTAVHEDLGVDSLPSDDLQILESILLDTQDPTLDELVDEMPFSTTPPQIRRISASRLVLRMTFAHEVPTHFEVVASTLWSCIAQTQKPVVQIPKKHSADSCGEVATKRKTYDDKIVFEFSGEPRRMDVRGELISGIILRESGYAVCSPLVAKKESCVSQIKMTLEIEIEVEQSIVDQQNLNTIVSILAQTNLDHMKDGIELIEGTLPRHQISV